MRFFYLYTMDIDVIYRLYLDSTGISTDTRSLTKGNLYFALKGNQFDGNKFAMEALKEGAFKVIADDRTIKSEDVIYVHNVLNTLQELAKIHRVSSNFKIIALTGSNGKTTTKELLYHIMSRRFKCAATEGNLNNHIGVPLTLLSFPKELEAGIIEMGANHKGEISNLCNIALPDEGIITNVGKAHLEGFTNIEGVASAKSELFHFLATNNGKIYFNSKLQQYIDVQKYPARQVIPYSSDTDEYRYEITGVDPYLNLRLFIREENKEIHTKLTGEYNAENILAAAVIASCNGVSIEDTVAGIENYSPSNNRSQRYKTKKNEIISDCYNANPTSMKLSIDNMLKQQAEKKLFIIGEMNELGSKSLDEHQLIIDYLKENAIASVYFVGESFYKTRIYDYQWFKNIDELIDQLKQQRIIHTLVLVKGSRTNQLEKIMDYL